jgi:uncharacterized protein YhdP
VYAHFSHVDVRQLHQQVSLDLEVKNAAGGLQAWVDWERGQVSGTTLNLALSQFQGRLAPEMAVLDLREVRGRLDVRRLAGGLELATRGLSFHTPDGGHWPGGDVRFEYVGGEGSLPGKGRLATGVIDVDVLASLVLKLPVATSVHDALRRHAPAGRLEHLNASWETRGAALTRFSVAGGGRTGQ